MFLEGGKCNIKVSNNNNNNNNADLNCLACGRVMEEKDVIVVVLLGTSAIARQEVAP